MSSFPLPPYHPLSYPSQPSPILSRPPPLNLSPLLNPIQPTSPILPHVLIPTPPGQRSRSPTPHPSLAIKHNLPFFRWFREPESILKLLVAEEQGVGRGLDGQIDGRGYVASGVFVRFADVY